LGVKIGLRRPFFRVQAAKNSAFCGHNAANMSISDAPDCASIRNFAENRLLAYICLLQSQKRFLATSANKAFAGKPSCPLFTTTTVWCGRFGKAGHKKWTRLSPCPICTSNLLIFIQS
jgi:hypothetical protein